MWVLGFISWVVLMRYVFPNLEFLGFKLDRKANEENRERLDAEGSAIAAVMFDTYEEIIVARETVRVISEL